MKQKQILGSFRNYYLLTKPGIIRGNLFTAAAGFLLASKGSVDCGLLVATLAGTALIIACGCVYNNYLDRNIDKAMKRTKKRALVTGEISVTSALTYGTVLGAAGFLTLALFTNAITVLLGAIGLFFYVVMYSIWKRRSWLGTMVGSVSGAVPVTAGYTAVSNRFDGAALVLFLILVCWQMPHFYSIAIFRFKDYQAAKLPVLPVQQSVRVAKMHIIAFILAFGGACMQLTVLGYTGYSFMGVMMALTLLWLHLGVKGFWTQQVDDVKWARKMFGFSLLVLLVFSIMISIDVWLP